MILHILLLILKIIGITLLVILGLLLLTVLLILFVPVRYRLSGRYLKLDNGFEAGALAKITWLLHFVSVKINYTEGLGYIVRVLGIPLIRGGNEEKKKKKGKKVESEIKEEQEEEEKTDIEEESGDEEKKEIEEDIGGKEEKEIKEETGENGDSEIEEAEKKEETEIEETAEEELDITAEKEEVEKKDETEIEEAEIKEEAGDKKEGTDGEKAEDETKKDRKKEKNKEQEKNVVNKLKNGYNKVTGMLEDKRVGRAWELVKSQTARLFKAIMPKKAAGHFYYGFEDPAITGYITALIASNYGRLHKLDIEPYFEEEILDVDLKASGRIFTITILCIAAKVYFNKDVRYTMDAVNGLKENDDHKAQN